jgi:hypothetical protein
VWVSVLFGGGGGGGVEQKCRSLKVHGTLAAHASGGDKLATWQNSRK